MLTFLKTLPSRIHAYDVVDQDEISRYTTTARALELRGMMRNSQIVHMYTSATTLATKYPTQGCFEPDVSMSV